MPCTTLSRVSNPYQFTPEIRNGWLDGLRICVPLVRHPPGTPETGVGLGVTVGVGPTGVGVFVCGLPAAIAVPEGSRNKPNNITPMTIMLRIPDFRIISFLLRCGLG